MYEKDLPERAERRCCVRLLLRLCAARPPGSFGINTPEQSEIAQTHSPEGNTVPERSPVTEPQNPSKISPGRRTACRNTRRDKYTAAGP